MRTILIDLPPSIKGFVSKVDDEEVIILNSRLSRETNEKTYLHELKHIAERDLDQPCEVNVIEMIRHK